VVEDVRADGVDVDVEEAVLVVVEKAMPRLLRSAEMPAAAATSVKVVIC
jgi:hypothetical protein